MSLKGTLARSATVAGLFAAAIGFASRAQAAEVQVTIDNFTFSPQQVTVKAGDTVTWTNHDDIPHTVTSTTKAFNSNALDTDDRFSFTFVTPGSFSYFCALHPHMTGSILVEASAGR
jgi:plastocyanin